MSSSAVTEEASVSICLILIQVLLVSKTHEKAECSLSFSYKAASVTAVSMPTLIRLRLHQPGMQDEDFLLPVEMINNQLHLVAVALT